MNGAMRVEAAIADVGASRVAVTGAGGFIGSVLLAGRSPQPATLADADAPDCVIHLAARPKDDLESFLGNVALDAAVFEYCNRNGSKLIYASTNNVYSLAENCRESDALGGEGLYALSKMAGERVLASGAFPGLAWVSLRLADVFGVGQRHGNLFRVIAESLATGSPLKLYGQGLKIRSYVYVKEVVAALEFCVSSFGDLQGEAFNLCHDRPASIAALVELIAGAAGLPVEAVAYEDRPDSRTMSNDKLKAAGYTFTYELEGSLRDFVEEAKRR